ncbi:hypothetical protein ACGFX8_14795 [Streptomyces sp. NPDC048362]|uniref:hypothetical protein n=1 Tax=Streptomyces sp. NPDC048362 TaxID=3365539 RepID=UPI0037101905
MTSGLSGGGQGARGLVSSPAEKRAVARAVEHHIEPGTREAGRWAEEDTATAVRALGARDGDGWLTSGALRAAHEAWAAQAGNLLDRLGAEKDALRATNTVLTGADIGTGGALRRVSALDRY